MKKLGLFLSIGFFLLVMVGCNNEPVENEVGESEHGSLEMDVRIEEVSETELLGQAVNNDQFDLMRINIEGVTLDFTPIIGQMVHVKIKDQVGMSQPPYTIAVEMTLLGP